jgi:hypothetical protein
MTIQVIKMQGGDNTNNTKNININSLTEEETEISEVDKASDAYSGVLGSDDEIPLSEVDEDEDVESEEGEDEDSDNEEEEDDDDEEKEEGDGDIFEQEQEIMNGGAGGDGDTVSSVSTTEILGKYPLFLVLTEFLMDDEGNNIVHVLHDINKNLAKIAKRIGSLQQGKMEKK